MIALRDGKSTPEFVEKILAVFGNNPHSAPNYRLIWSERKMIWFLEEVAPEYVYFDPCWILETWVPPFLAAGSEADWAAMAPMLGEYPQDGVYFYSNQFPSDWSPSEENVRLVAKALEESKHLPYQQRVDAIRANLQHKEREGMKRTADAIVESFDSAAMGRIQQAVSGPKNTFRTPEDFERDQEKILVTNARLPKSGGKILH